MTLLAVGLNHNTAPLAVREATAFPSEQFAAALDDLLALPAIDEGAILSTCNRTEIYAVAETDAASALRAWLARQRGLEDAAMARYCYTHRDRETVRHALRVASGLDSMILGEPQILGQMKDAYRQARAARGVGTLLTRLFEHSFAVAKRVRSHTDVGANPVSVASAGVGLAQQIFSDISTACAMLVGAGDTVDLTARHLLERGVSRIVFANRSIARAQALAARYHGYAIALADVPAHLAEADMLIAATSAPGYIVHLSQLRAAIKARRRKPIFVLDLAVPRDIDPAAAELEDIYLYSVDDLQSVVQDNLDTRRRGASRAETMLDDHIDEYIDWLESRQAADTIKTMRARAQAQRDEVLAHAKRQLAAGRPPEQVLETAARRLANKLMHAPSAALRNARGARQQRLLHDARTLFDLDTQDRHTHTDTPTDTDP